jgi:mannosyltransferase
VRPALIAVAALTVLAAVIRFYRIGHQGFWFDEATTALLVHFSPGKMLGLIPTSESTPPLYYCIAWVWVRVFGDGETGLRSLSAVAGVATVPIVYCLGARLSSVRAGMIAAALAACNPLLIWYSQEARAYQLLVLLSAASLLAFTYLLERPTPRSAAAWAILSGLALATEYYAVLVVAPAALWLLYRHRRSRAVQVAIGFVVVVGLALVPLVLRQERTGRSKWIAHISLARRVKQLVPQFVIAFGSPAYGVLEPLAVALAVFGVVLLVTRAAGLERRGAYLAGAIALGGLVLSLLLIAAGIDDLLTRNLLALWVPAAIAVSAGFAVRRPRLLGAGAATALCVIGLVAAVGVARTPDLQRPRWQELAGLIGIHPPPGGREILVQRYKDLLPLSLYLPGLKFVAGRHPAGTPPQTRVHRATVSEFDIVAFNPPDSGGVCWWGSACNLKGSTLQASYPIPGFRAVWRRQVYRWTVLRMVAVNGPTLVTAGTVARLLHTTVMKQDELVVQH